MFQNGREKTKDVRVCVCVCVCLWLAGGREVESVRDR